MEKHVGIKSTLFIIILLIFIIGGFILMQRSVPQDNTTNNSNSNNTNIEDIRLDVAKEYIYYSNVEHITHELDIEYKDITINFKDDNNLASMLNDETKTLKSTIKYDKTNDRAIYDGLTEAKYRLNNEYYFDNYISLVLDYYAYDCETLITYLSTKAYVFDKTSGNLLSEEELLKAHSLTKDEVKSKVEKHLEDLNVGKEEKILIDETLDKLTSLNLFVDKIGRLSLSLLVKSEQSDYNEVIILN